ncbi:hypothetical protein [Chryseobacterium sp. EO14]|uniref:hypothetical protein n=1 Tax=Chryseobacterium sp. EO14 TaxID=2950551 RepID=UPI00210D90A5|nr:hypothetical protein [Chryseobacterium sp. EO14]MCQ4139229.1 hypothetical protein [Chryseobacterium sp. EO14]
MYSKDIFYSSKHEILQELASIHDVVFVGGTSEYLQGIKSELNDIDISIPDTFPLKKIGYVFHFYRNNFYGLSGNRGVIKLKNVLIDIFIDNPPEYIIVNGFKCETIQSMINLRETTLKFNSDQFADIHKKKLADNLERLRLYILSKYESF